MQSTMWKLLAGVGLVSMMAVGSLSAAPLAAGPHDLTGDGPVDAIAGPTTDLCRFCHTPHNARTNADMDYLWDRKNPVTASFTVYTSVTMGNTAIQPEGVSLACLSCHDGATAFDALQGVTDSGNGGTALNAMINRAPTSTANFGSSLLNDHPVSVSVDAANEMNSVANITAADLVLYAGTGTNQVECASCHDPHGDGTDWFLRIPSATGGLCETCHNK